MAKTAGGLRATRPANSNTSNQVSDADFDKAEGNDNLSYLYGRILNDNILTQTGISENNANTINAYTRHAFKINTKLRHNSKLDESEIQYLKNLEKSLNSLPNENKSLILYRGVSIKKENANQFKAGSLIEFNHFLSTSSDYGTALSMTTLGFKSDTKIIFTIESHKNAKNISMFSRFYTEEERLFNRNSRFKIIETRDDNGILKIKLKQV
jgi:hypothetical protein